MTSTLVDSTSSAQSRKPTGLCCLMMYIGSRSYTAEAGPSEHRCAAEERSTMRLVFDRRVSGCAEGSVVVGVWSAVYAAESLADVSADSRQVPLRVQSARSVQHIPGRPTAHNNSQALDTVIRCT